MPSWQVLTANPPSISVVTVNRNKLNWICGLFLVLAVASTASAQNRRSAVRQDERVARAQWQPVRSVQHSESIMAEPIPRGNALPEGEVVLESIQGEPIYEGFEGYPGDEVYHDSFSGHGACDAMGCSDQNCGQCRGGVSCGWRPCMTFCLPQDGWVSMEYLLWWQDGMDLPPLVSSGNTANGGVPSQGADILFGGGEYLTENLNGGRLRAGIWLDACHTWALEGEYFSTGTLSTEFSRTGSGNDLIARPFYNTVLGRDDAELVSFPGTLTGRVDVQASTQLKGMGFAFRRLLACGDGCGDTFFCNLPQQYTHRLDGLIGYRWLELDDTLTITESLLDVTPDPSNTRGDTFNIVDSFRSRSQFNGLDFGANYHRERGCWSLDLLAKLALGTTRQTVTINGSTISPDGVQRTGGLLTQTSNIGTYKRDRFSVAPELGAKLGYKLSKNLSATVGYSFIYWSNVARVGDQVDTDVNTNLLPPANGQGGVQRPGFAFVDSDYWVQGISFGGEYRW